MMAQRTKDSYLMLIRQILRLLRIENQLKENIAVVQAGWEGMKLSGKDVSAFEGELNRIKQTLRKIARNHAKLIELLRERLYLKLCLRRKPRGNADHFRRIKDAERLRATKGEIGRIIAV